MSDLRQINKDAINVLNTETLVDGTFKDIVDSYSLTSEVLKLSQKNINDSLIKKGVTTSLDAKLSTVPEKILDLPNMGGTLEIVPPNVGAVIDTNKQEYNTTKISANYSADGNSYLRTGSNNYLVPAYTDNFIAFASLSSRLICYKKYNDSLFLEFQIPSYGTNQFCSAHNGDLVYSFNEAGPTNVMNCNVYDLSDTDLSFPKETHLINNCNNIVWCDTIDGVIHLAYRETSSGMYYFGTYKPGDLRITQKFSIGSTAPVSVAYDEKYFYISAGSRYVFYNTRDFSSPILKNIQLSLSGIPTCVVPFGNKLLATYGYDGASLFFGIDSPSPGTRLVSLITDYTDIVAVIDDTHFIASCSSTPYARLLRLDYNEATSQYSAKTVSTFVNINTSSKSNPRMIIAKDLLGKQYLGFARYKSFITEGINAEYEFELERRN
ncbi:hypothetical protein NSA24_10535 [Clostridioides mangenotii]|uniref:hypothetical protein n=1 Tax=Metaclostridioides mangenotii TaxID=1540 RepID=UPI00214A4EBE|nr:hypothetical protein [Clostridioides mangenotii]MCR1955228.1 hypothetical protein [Clostridioides mangenotii]